MSASAAPRPSASRELLDLQAPGGPLERLGVDHFVELIERRRVLLCQVRTIAGTEYLDTLEQLIGLMYEKVNRTASRGDRTRG